MGCWRNSRQLLCVEIRMGSGRILSILLNRHFGDIVMLAYVFWHRPHPDVERAAYEGKMKRFQQALLQHPSPGLTDAWSWRIEALPWLGSEAGYEDWCLLQGSWAMDPLNAYAVTGDTKVVHDPLAAQMAVGAGGLYSHVCGDPCTAARSTVLFLTRPRGIDWQSALEPVRATAPKVTIWRRQMVLGPAPEFAVEVPGDGTIAVPAGWEARTVRRERLAP
jgi:hypothetical protein